MILSVGNLKMESQSCCVFRTENIRAKEKREGGRNMRKQQHNVQASTTAGFWLYWCEKIHLHIMAHQWPYTHTHIHKPHVGTSASVCIEKHLRTKPPEVSTFLDGKQAWKLLSHAGQVSGINSPHNNNPPPPPPYTHTHARGCKD